ncbi:error-prone DNA polymerase [Aliidiomarina celeris]|uniref:error-prone DNA polymerase n=1 Tax=Aliidiomarina celeris TaxID=2249428 RepID=UPI000DEBDAC1|nr:error-prone DNA polymerase [Aliidiomarina celeris]
MAYTALHCFTHYTFLQSTNVPAELINKAADLGYRAIAITDECSVAGMVKAWQAAKSRGIHLLVGAEFRSADQGRFLLYAKNRTGYGQLCALISCCRRAANKGSYQFTVNDLIQFNTSECLCVWLPPVAPLSENAESLFMQLQQVYSGRAWIGYARALQDNDFLRLKYLMTLSHKFNWPLVSCSMCTQCEPESADLLEVMHAIQAGCRVEELGYRAERSHTGCLLSTTELEEFYELELLQQSNAIANLCTFDPQSLRYEYPAEVVPPGKTPDQWLGMLTREGAQRRYPNGVPKAVAEQLERELTLVRELGYAHFFLTIHDIVSFAREQGILHQGRGSAANSAVCYCLGITAVNPAQSQLLFERFISKERNEPPDIDVDFEHERREEVIQYIYQKYGRERAALAATVITYRLRSALRDVGKALGFSQGLLAELLARLDRRDREEGWQQQLESLGVLKHPRGHALIKLTQALLGTPRHLSQHVGGFVISAGPLSELVPVENAAMKERTVIQWDKDDLEALCLLKVDVLALGMLTALRKSLALLPEFYQQNYRLENIPQEDPLVYQMLQQADSVGLFQIESRAQMNMLPRLKPKTFYDLVVQIAIVRPGPIQGDMVHPYLRRRDGLEPVDYPSDAVADVLKRTLGVPIFQEQVIKLAMVAAGFSGGEADQLRRAMAAWKSHGQLEPFRYKLIQGMLARGYSESFAERLYAQIKGFGEYGFPESHAASFAILAYASAWLKYHFPAAFYVGLLNSLPMGFYSPSQLIQDARRHNLRVHAVCVNASEWDHRLVTGSNGPEIQLGFRLVKGLEPKVVARLLQHRPAEGFASMSAIKALQLPSSTMANLASANAFAAIAGHRYQARWEMESLGEQLPLLAVTESSQLAFSAPHPLDNMREDYQAMGLTLGDHPVALLRNYLHKHKQLPQHKRAESLAGLRHGQIVTVLGLVTGRQRPGTSKGVTFLTLEDDTGNVNVVLWQDVGRKQRKEWLHARLLMVRGTLEKHGDIVHVVAGRLKDYTDRLPLDRIASRNFH